MVTPGRIPISRSRQIATTDAIKAHMTAKIELALKTSSAELLSSVETYTNFKRPDSALDDSLISNFVRKQGWSKAAINWLRLKHWIRGGAAKQNKKARRRRA